MKFNDNTIDYNSIPNSKPAGAASVSGQIFDLNNKFWELEEGDTPSTLVNAVDIDWNSAILPNGNPEDASDLTINTTGELLRMIINTGSPMWAN